MLQGSTATRAVFMVCAKHLRGVPISTQIYPGLVHVEVP